ncbi:mucin-5AC isoform X6 [Megalobrama amblycephala]|nr:mucin-5AC isoform X6 [Megalobrama amblycephala]
MTPNQNKKCTAVTFTTTPPTTTDSTSMASSRTNEASTEYPTTATVSNTMSSSITTGTESSITTDSTTNAASTTTTTTPPSSTKTNEETKNTAVTPTTTLTSSSATTATNAAPTTTAQSSTTEDSTTTAVNPSTMPVSPAPTTAPPATENIASTEKPSSAITSEAYTTTDVTHTTTPISSPSSTAPSTTTNAAPTTTAQSSTTEASTTTAVNPTTMHVSPAPTNAPPATENAVPTTIAQTSTTRPPTETTFVTPTTMPMFSEITTFLTTTSLQNATQISLTHNPDPTAFEDQSTISLATTATSAPTLIIVTQETTMSLSMSTTDASPTTIVTPLTESGAATTQTTAVVNTTLLFNSSSPVPSEALVLSAINTLRRNRESQLNDSVKVVNVTYQKISETSYAVVFTFNLNNISMPVNSDLRNDTYQKVQNTINNALNTLLNEPGKQVFVPKTSNFTSTSNQIDGSMGYTFQDGDAIQPVSFLNELRKQMELTTTTVSSSTITSFPLTSPSPISGSAVVTSKLLFSSSSPVPSEALVLSAINTLQRNRESQLNDSVKVVNVTYQKISETSYAVVFTFNLNNISMPVNSDLRNDTYQKVQNTINNALNTLLNEPGKQVFVPKTSNFTSTSNQIDGSMGYTFQDGDAIQPVSFLNELRKQMELTTTTVSSSTITSFPSTSPSPISGTAVVTSKLLFSSSSPVPSEALVLSAINTLQRNRESQLNDSVKVVNVTYQKISETSYAVVIAFSLSNISMPEVPELRNNTYTKVQDVVNNALNTLLNEPGNTTLQPESSNFTSTFNQINGRMGYTFQDGDAIQPVSFLKELRSQLQLTTTTAFPESTTGSSVTSQNLISGTAVVTSKLLFSSSSPVPSEALVLSAINTLQRNRESQLNDSVKVVNVTYQKISETSYAVVIAFSLSNISMPEVPELRNNTYTKVQDVVNNALNTLLNEPGNTTLQPESSNFISTFNQINGSMGYTFRDGDAIQPVSFLKELRSQLQLTTTTAFPESTAGSSVTSQNLISGSAVVTSKLLFSSSSPVPSEALVLSAINTLQRNRESQLNDSVKVVNVTYQKISETSYAVVIAFSLSNISMPEVPELRNNTYKKVQDVVNNALNTLLNEPGNTTLQPESSNFMSTFNQINGSMGYTFRDGDAIQPVSFLKELRSQLQLTTTTAFPESTTGSSVTSQNLISGTAVVTSKLLFSSSSPVPSEALVLSAINTLRRNRESQLNDSVKVVNVTYQKISETSYAVVITFSLSNISMPEVPELRNNTYKKVQDVVNNALNTLLNEPGNTTLQPESSNFMSTSNQVNGSMGYTFQDGDAIQPVSFLTELRLQTVSTTAGPLTTITTSPPTVLGRVIIFIRLVFVTLGPLPNENEIIQVANTLLYSRLITKLGSRAQPLSDPVNFVNITYTKMNETAYTLNFGFEISNVSMSEKLEFRNETYLTIQDSINTLLNKILNNDTAPTIKFQPGDFTDFSGNSTTIQANVTYVFSNSNITQPSIFIQELLQVIRESTLTTTTASTTTPQPISKVVIKIRLVFVTLGPIPSESDVLRVVKSVLASNLTTKLSTRATVIPSDPVIKADVTYSRINDTAYALDFEFEINSLSVNDKQRNQAYGEIQNKINNLVIEILNNPSAALSFIPANFSNPGSSSIIIANVTYVFSQNDSNSYTVFGRLVGQLFITFTTPAPTTINTTVSNNSTNAAWVVAIIVPVAIVLGLIPCWILLCCLLCGCCAAIRRRWHRRQSYNVQYTTRNSLF